MRNGGGSIWVCFTCGLRIADDAAEGLKAVWEVTFCFQVAWVASKASDGRRRQGDFGLSSYHVLAIRVSSLHKPWRQSLA